MRYLSKCIATWLIKYGVVEQEDKELYEYAAYSLILSISPLIMIMIIGLLMGRTVESILIIIPFMFIRKFSGGYHAKYAWVCMISSCGILLLCVYMVARIKYSMLINIILICAAISLTILSPIDSENRRLDLSEIKKYKITTIVMTMIFVIIYCLFLLADNKIYAICIAEGIILTASLQTLCLFEKIKLVSKNEDNATKNETEVK